jgi:hypothetical protein
MKRERAKGTALLAVTLLGVLLLGLAMTLVGVTRATNLQSYGLNRRLVCRYAAEGVLHEIKFRVQREANLNTPGWFDTASKQADPVLVQYCPTPSNLSPLVLAHADSPLVRVSIYDPAEALAKFNKALGSGEYIVEAKATLDKFTVALHLRLVYKAVSTSTAVSSPSGLFSKYLLWTTSQSNSTSGDTYLYAGESDGYVHIEGDVRLSDYYTRIGMPITATGNMDYWTGSSVTATPWYKFDSNWNNTLDTTARPDRMNTSEADARGQSGGYKPSVPQPSYADIEARFLEAAKLQRTANPSLNPLWIDPANPEYAAIGTISHSTIKLDHDSSTGVTKARIVVYGSAGSRAADVALPPGVPTIILTSARIASLSGTYYANLTVASTYAGAPTDVTIYPGFPEFPTLPTLGAPAITIDDHIINVDQAGRPKQWVYKEPTSKPWAYQGMVIKLKSDPSTTLPADGDMMPTKGSFHGRPPSNRASLFPLVRWSRRILGFAGSPQTSPETPLAAPSRLKLTGLPVNDVAGGNIDSEGSNWSNPPRTYELETHTVWPPTAEDVANWEKYVAELEAKGDYRYSNYEIDYFQKKTGTIYSSKFKYSRNSTHSALQPSVLGIYSRGDTMIKTPNLNHLGTWAFYGGDPRSRIYVDPVEQRGNRAFLGSQVSPQTALSNYRVASSTKVYVDNGFRYGKFANYDWDFLVHPPPFWIAPGTTTTTSEVRLTVSFGSISEETVR